MSAPLWQPSAAVETLRQRARILAEVRDFFNSRSYLEVDTPVMAHYGVSDVHLANIQAIFRNNSYSLQTSPEYHMKRLLAAGIGPIFQLARVFRDDELGRWHNPEFTLLEWYRPGFDHHELMAEVDVFLQTILHTPSLIKKTYQQAFLEACDLDPFSACVQEMHATLNRHGLGDVLSPENDNRDAFLFLLMSHVVEPFLGKEKAPVAVFHFPPSQASLARISNGVAERFEVYYRGVELANGFHELTDAKAQAERFSQDLAIRASLGLPTIDPDIWLLQALEKGIPPCSGVALGIDRLLALALEKSSIAEVTAFSWERA